MMRIALTCLLVFVAASAETNALELGEQKELLRLPVVTVARSTRDEIVKGLVRVSPQGNRLAYLGRQGRDVVLRTVDLAAPGTGQPVPACQPIPERYWTLGFSGYCWRSDGMQLSYIQADAKEESDFKTRLRSWVFKWDLPLPQAASRGYGVRGAPSCTAVSFGPTGKGMYWAYSNLVTREVAAVVAPGRAAVVYRTKDVGIFHLTPSPDGKRLAWVEMPPRTRRTVEPTLAVLDIATRKVIHREFLSTHIVGWRDMAPPVWSADGKVLCFGDVVQAERAYRREVRAITLADGTVRPVLRDAVAVGAVGRYLLLNRGPACSPYRQSLSSYAPPRGTLPERNNVLACDLAEPASSLVTLIPNAFAQEVVESALIHTVKDGGNLLIFKTLLKW